MSLPRLQFPWRQKLRALIVRPQESAFADYGAWSQFFFKKRLILGLSLALTYFTAISGVIAWAIYTGHQTNLFQLAYHVLTAIIMAVALWAVRRARKPWHLTLSFFILCWGISIVTNLPRGWDDVIKPDYKAWTFGFFSIGAIVPFHWQFHLISHLGAYIYYFWINHYLGNPLIPDDIDPFTFYFDLAWLSALPVFAVHLYEELSKLEFTTRRALREEKQRSEQLLLDILPVAIAHRLRNERATIADGFDDVTVLFADLVGFTEFSHQLTPHRVVTILNDIFSRFDRLTQTYQLEKIKTIGDAYMLVGGVPDPCPDHAQRVAAIALAMQQELDQFSATFAYPFKMRIGIHTGPVVAGVIGLHKFAYDLWGDTVNTASRMESHGLPGKIQISQQTYNHIQSFYLCQPRGKIPVKGKGEMLTYWLVGHGESSTPPYGHLSLGGENPEISA